jgi:hypothetical protein
MVRRIVPDSDFDSEDETGQMTGDKKEDCRQLSNSQDADEVSPVNSPKAIAPPRSVRKVVRQRDLEPAPAGTYDYDSDIYTEESSMGSFIVDSEDDDCEQQSTDENTGTSTHMQC